jgi:exosortase/archaeosortase family protein
MIIVGGLLMGLWFFPTWLGSILSSFTGDPSFPCLIAIAACLGLSKLWKQRQALAQLKPKTTVKVLGYSLIGVGIVLFPVCSYSFSLQAALWLLILIGIALSSWGIEFFKQYLSIAFLMALSVHSGSNVLLGSLWRFINQELTENLTAWGTGLVLKVLGYQVTVSGNFIDVHSTNRINQVGTDILVGFPCSGFDAALTLAVAGLLLGICWQEKWTKTIRLIFLGVVLAFVFNGVRVTVLAIAANQGGNATFDFWHGGHGSQLFSVVMFACYYLLILKLFPQRNQISVKSNPVSS